MLFCLTPPPLTRRTHPMRGQLGSTSIALLWQIMSESLHHLLGCPESGTRHHHAVVCIKGSLDSICVPLTKQLRSIPNRSAIPCTLVKPEHAANGICHQANGDKRKKSK